MIVRLYSAGTTRDYLFLALLAFSAMLASAILTVDTTFLCFSSCLPGAGDLHVHRPGDAPQRRRRGLDAHRSRARRRRAAAHGVWASPPARLPLARCCSAADLFPDSALHRRLSFRLQSAASLISGFSDDVELGQIGEIKRSSAVVMRIKVEGGTRCRAQHALARHRADHVRRTPLVHRRPRAVRRQPRAPTAGSPSTSASSAAERRYSSPFDYTVLLEPMASDALFVAAEPAAFAANSSTAASAELAAAPQPIWSMDQTGSLSNPFHNFAELRYEAVSDGARRFPPTICASPPRRLSRTLRDALPAIAASSIRASRRWPDRSPAARAIPTIRRAPSKATCAAITATRWISPARRRPIRWLISFSSGAPATANISPRP